MKLPATALARYGKSILTVLLVQTVLACQPAPRVEISDLAGHRAEATAIRNMVAQGIMLTGEQGRFRPDTPTTRAELAASVQRLFDLKPPAQVKDFPDVPPGSPLYMAVQSVGPYLGRQILCFGCALISNFLPDEPASQLETAVLLTNVLRAENKVQLLTEAQAEAVLADVTDAKTLRGAPLRVYAATAIQAEIIKPPPANPFVLASFPSRAQTAVVLDNVQKTFKMPMVRPGY